MRTTLLATALFCLMLMGCASTPAADSAGWKQIELHDYQGALRSFDHALGSSQDAQLHAGRARALFFLGRLDEARRGYETAIAQDPSSSQWHIGLGVLQLAQGDEFGATAAFDAAIEIDPRLAKAYYNRGCAQLRVLAYDSALADFTQAIRIDVNHSRAYNSRGVVLAHMGRFDAAIEDFQSAMRITPTATAHGNIAAAYYARGRSQDALSELNLAIRMERTNPVHHMNRGRIYLDLGRADLAVADFEQALVLAPGAAEVSQLLAQAYSESRLEHGHPVQTARPASFTD